MGRVGMVGRHVEMLGPKTMSHRAGFDIALGVIGYLDGLPMSDLCILQDIGHAVIPYG